MHSLTAGAYAYDGIDAYDEIDAYDPEGGPLLQEFARRRIWCALGALSERLDRAGKRVWDSGIGGGRGV